MSSDNKSQVIPCAGCGSKLRVGANAQGKTIACPKCGQQVKIDAAQPSRKLVLAKPIAAPAAAPLPPANLWDTPTAAAPSNYQPYPTNSATAGRKPSGKNPMLLWLAIGGGGALLLSVVAVAVIIAYLASGPSRNTPPTVAAAPSGPGASSRPSNTRAVPSRAQGAPVPSRTPTNAFGDNSNIALPPLGPAMPFGDKIELHRVTISRAGKLPFVMNIFIPKGTHADRSLPVMFESPSGTNLLHGAQVDFPRLQTEILPFTDAGMITVSFSIDGYMPQGLDPSSGRAYFRLLEHAYLDFSASGAGVGSGKLAVDYVLKQVPQADPNRLYIWGHSSSATLALLMASKDSRLVKCIALAPITDMNLRMGDLLSDATMKKSFPNLDEHFKTGSPINFVQSLKCPVFIAHAQDDDNEPFKNTELYVESLQKAGGNVKFEALTRGGHYSAMLNECLPKAVEWAQQ